MVEAESAISRVRYHRQRLHVVVAAMRRFAESLRARGFEVDYRRADTFASGLDAHRAEHRPTEISVMEPSSWGMRVHLGSLGVTVVESNQFLCTRDEFADWARGRRRIV